MMHGTTNIKFNLTALSIQESNLTTGGKCFACEFLGIFSGVEDVFLSSDLKRRVTP